MFPTKVIAFSIILLNSEQSLKSGIEGMMIGTFLITVPLLTILWILTK